MTKAQTQMLRTIRAGGDIQCVKCPTIQALIRLGWINIEPTAYGMGRCTIRLF